MIKRNKRNKRNKKKTIVKRNTSPVKFIQLTTNSAKILKKKLYIAQGSKCPVLRKKINVRDAVLDHRHKLKTQKPGPRGRGLVRGALHFQVNAFEGIVLKKYKRYGLTDMIDLPELLHNLADYLLHPTCPQCYIYPSEKVKAATFGKRDYDRICKYYFVMFPRARKLPIFPKSGIKKKFKKVNGKKKVYYVYKAKLSNKWQKLLEKANEIHTGSKRKKK